MSGQSAISISDSDIEKIVKVDIVSEFLDLDAITTLTPDQIRLSITNLIDNNPDDRSTYYEERLNNEINSILEMLESKNIELKKFGTFRNVMPIVNVRKTLYSNDVDEKENFIDVATEIFVDWIKNFYRQNSGKNQDFTNFRKKMFYLQKPFVDKQNFNAPIKSNVFFNIDAIRIKNLSNPFYHITSQDTKFYGVATNNDEIIRLCSRYLNPDAEKTYNPDPTRFYDCIEPYELEYPGDYVEIIGYYIANNRRRFDYVTFDIDSYITNLKSIKTDEFVTIYWNIPRFNQALLIKEQKGKVFKINKQQIWIKLDFQISSLPHGVGGLDEIVYKIEQYNSCMIYSQNGKNEFRYNKSKLLDDINILCRGNKKDAILDFCVPCNISELIALEYYTICELTMYAVELYFLRKYEISLFYISGLEMQLLLDIISNTSLHIKFSNKRPQISYSSKNSPDLLAFEKILDYGEIWNQGGAQLNNSRKRWNFLKSRCDRGYEYFYQLIKQIMKNKFSKKNVNDDFVELLEKEEQNLHNIDNKLKKIESSDFVCPQHFIIAKKYNNKAALQRDNQTKLNPNKKIYWDLNLDQTPYNLKLSISTNEVSKSDLIVKLCEIKPEENIHEINFIAESILQGSRKVRLGEHAILSENGDSIYVRQKIEAYENWIKLSHSPDRILDRYCSESLENFDEIIKKDSCILDDFENVCSLRNNIKMSRKLKICQENVNILRSIVELMHNDKLKSINKHIDQSIIKYQLRLKSCQNIQNFSINIDKHVSAIRTSTENFTGDHQDADSEMYELTYQEGLSYNTSIPVIKNFNPVSKIVNMLINQCGIEITDEFEIKICNIVDQRNKFESLKQAINLINNKAIEEKKEYDKKYHSRLKDWKNYYDEEKIRLALDRMLEKISKEKNENTKKAELEFDKKVIFDTISLIVIFVMAYFPKIKISVYPTLTNHFAYAIKNFPDDKTTHNRYLEKYFGYVLREISKYNEKIKTLLENKETSQQQQWIEWQLIETIKSILNEYTVYKNLINNHENYVEYSTHDISYIELHPGFKPSFKFDQGSRVTLTLYQDTIVKYLEYADKIVKNAAFEKVDQYNRPLYINACCREIINNNISYLSRFRKNSKFLKIEEEIKNFIKTHQFSYCYIPKTKLNIKKEIVNFFSTDTVLEINPKTIYYSNSKKHLPENKNIVQNKYFRHNENLFDLLYVYRDNYRYKVTKIIKELENDYNELDQIYKQLDSDGSVLNAISILKNTTILGEAYNINSRVNTLSRCLKVGIKSLMYKKLTKDMSIRNRLSEKVRNDLLHLTTDIFESISDIVDVVYMTDEPDEIGKTSNSKKIATQKNIRLAYLLNQILKHFLCLVDFAETDSNNVLSILKVTINNITPDLQTIMVLVSDIINYVSASIFNNDIDYEKIIKRNEEFREKSKKAKIDRAQNENLSEDEKAERAMLRKIGLSSTSAANDNDIPDDFDNIKELSENEKIDTPDENWQEIPGENDDDYDNDL